MARIRSVHPGIFTDEAFMEAPAMARLLAIGLWTEAWDDGVFEWKPKVLKARIFPADNCDVDAMLADLVRLRVIKRVERDGKSYGLIRNFRRFQRPKKPNESGIEYGDDASWLGLSAKDFGSRSEISDNDGGAEGEEVAENDGNKDGHFPTGSEPVPNQYRTGGEIPPQMEDGGWRMEDGTTSFQQHPVIESERREPSPPTGASRFDRTASDDLEHRLRQAAGYEVNPAPNLLVVGPIEALIGEGFDLDREILPVIRAKAMALKKPVQSWGYFVPVIRAERDESISGGGRRGASRDGDRVEAQLAEARRRLADKRKKETDDER